MRNLRGLLLVATLAGVFLPPASPASGQDIYVWGFQGTNGEDHFPPGSSTPYIRRGRTSAVRIIKDLIDLVPKNMISVSGGGASISSITQGTQSGHGYVQMNMAVPSGTATGTTITLSVGLTDRFTFRVVRAAIISTMTPNPNPSTIQAGTQWTASFSGTDMGNPALDTSRLQCHTTSVAGPQNAPVVTLTRSASCATTSYTIAFSPIAGETPSAYRKPNGDRAEFAFAYAPPPPSGVTCVSQPNISNVVVSSPQPNQTFVYGPATPSTVNVTMSWSSITQPSQVAAPLNEFVISKTIVTTGAIKQRPTTSTVTGTSTSLQVGIPGTYEISIRAKNCGDPAPTTTFRFSTRYQ